MFNESEFKKYAVGHAGIRQIENLLPRQVSRVVFQRGLEWVRRGGSDRELVALLEVVRVRDFPEFK